MVVNDNDTNIQQYIFTLIVYFYRQKVRLTSALFAVYSLMTVIGQDDC